VTYFTSSRHHGQTARWRRTTPTLQCIDREFVVTNPIHPLYGQTIKASKIFSRLGEQEVWVENAESIVLKVPAWSTDLERGAYQDCQFKLGIFSVERLLILAELMIALCSNVPNFSLETGTQPGRADETGQRRHAGSPHHGSRLGNSKPASRDMGQVDPQNARNGGRR